MIDQVYRCDVCNTPRGETNHWLIAFYASTHFYVYPWSDKQAEDPAAKHLCGSDCAHKVLGRYLESLRNGESNG